MWILICKFTNMRVLFQWIYRFHRSHFIANFKLIYYIRSAFKMQLTMTNNSSIYNKKSIKSHYGFIFGFRPKISISLKNHWTGSAFVHISCRCINRFRCRCSALHFGINDRNKNKRFDPIFSRFQLSANNQHLK